MTVRPVFAVLLLLLALPVFGEGLRYRIEGGSEQARENIRARLGASPQDEGAAQRFLVTLRDRTRRALEALGIYDYSLDIAVDQSVDPWQALLTLEHAEPLLYTDVSIALTGAGETDLQLQEMVAGSAPAVGDQLHHGEYEAFKDALLRRARELGYFEARFGSSELRVDPQARVAEAVLVFDSGPRFRFGEVLADPRMLAPELLDELLPFQRGEAYEQQKLLELRGRLLRLGYFNSVVVRPDLAAGAATEVPVVVELMPAPRHSYELGVGYSTDTRQRLSVLWRSPRLNSRGHSQQTRISYSPVNPQAQVTYNIPLDAPANDLLQFGARLEDNEFGDLSSLQQELSLRREMSRGLRVTSYSLRALNESWDVLTENFQATYPLFGASFSRRQRQGDAVDPRRGFSQFYAIEGASNALGADQDLLRVSTSLLGLKRISDKSRWVARVSAGLLWSTSETPDELPPSLAFFAGGDNSIRGYGYQSVGREVQAPAGSRRQRLVVGGTRLLTGSVEYQRYINEQWRIAAFVDGGDAFTDSNFDLKVGLGVGVHYLTPLGAVRIEIAQPVSESGASPRLHINIGAEL